MKKILIVDDEDIIRFLLVDVLTSDEFEILEAANGKEAVEIIENDCPDLIITDTNMPIMDGFEVVEFLNKNNNTSPVIMMSANNSDAYRQKANSLGIRHIVIKPFSLDEIADLVNKLLNE